MDSAPTITVKRMWHIVRVMYYMFRKSIPKRKLMMDVHMLIKQGKLTGKKIGNIMFHHNNTRNSTTTSAFWCRNMETGNSYYDPREVQLSCTSTPSHPTCFQFNKRKRANRYHHHYDVKAVTKAFELLNSAGSKRLDDEDDDVFEVGTSLWSLGKSPAMVRQLRVTDSPFPVVEEEDDDGVVDKEAELFIQRFYAQLRQ